MMFPAAEGLKAVIRQEFPGLTVDDYRTGKTALTRGVYLYYAGISSFRTRLWVLSINLGAYALDLEEAGLLYGMLFRYQQGIVLSPKMEVFRRIPQDTSGKWEMVVTFGMVSDTEFPQDYLPYEAGSEYPAETALVYNDSQVDRFGPPGGG